MTTLHWHDAIALRELVAAAWARGWFSERPVSAEERAWVAMRLRNQNAMEKIRARKRGGA